MAPPDAVKICSQTFLAGSFSCLLHLLFTSNFQLQKIWAEYWILVYLLYFLPTFGFTRVICKTKDAYEIGIRGAFLGWTFGLGILITLNTATWISFGLYLAFLSFFHWSEYFITAVINPRSLTLESYLLDHSREYKLAAVASWIEFTVEWFIFPGLKQLKYVRLVGTLAVIMGETVRKLSMITASTNFNHYVQYIKQKDHQLVTHGIYSLCRHPSYVGWFLWSIGTQVILCNPVCLVGYTVVSWRFFRERIYEEELCLCCFFGDKYTNYQKRVGTGIPFIHGYVENL